jgi:hypothetical protein
VGDGDEEADADGEGRGVDACGALTLAPASGLPASLEQLNENARNAGPIDQMIARLFFKAASISVLHMSLRTQGGEPGTHPVKFGYGPPPGGGYGPPPGGGYGPPPGGGPPQGGGYGPPPGGGYGPPQGPPGGYGPPGYGPPGGPQGYRPQPPKSGGSAGKIVGFGCLGLFILAAAGFGFAQYKARAKFAEYNKTYKEAQATLTAASTKLDDALLQKGGIDACVASVNSRLAKIHAAKDDPPTAIPDGATLVCDSTSWQSAGCSTPTAFLNNTAFSPIAACTDPSAAELKALNDLNTSKPYASDTDTADAWSKKVDAAVAAHQTALATMKNPGVIAATSFQCDVTPLESFVDNTNNTHRQLEANTCQVTLTWADATGNILGRLKATGHGSPPDTARKSSTLSDSELTDANVASQHDGIENGWAELQKRIDFVNKKAGSTAPKTPSAAPTTKAPVAAPKPPVKPPVTPPKKK